MYIFSDNKKIRILILSLIMAFPLTCVPQSCYAKDLNNIQKALDENATPGAKYVGIDQCALCHEDIVKHYRIESHYGTSLQEGEKIVGEACESCHGPGSLHADNSGDKSKIIRYSPERCFTCHADIRAQFQLQYHHPIEKDQVRCLDCHNIHSSQNAAFNETQDLERNNEKCFRCHKEFKGPFVFEHDPIREGCQTCHEPHGSVFNKLLIADVNALCLRCHWEPNTNLTSANIGGLAHGSGAVAENAFIGAGEKCIDHHKSPHGSNSWRTLDR